jgi:nucleoside-diphosphate-sugar epimerase
MRVLLTGASSFSGIWFARRLAEAGHEVVAVLPRAGAAYTDGVRAQRVAMLKDLARIVWSAPFGGDAFLDLVREESFDVLAHHAAVVGNYRSPDYNMLDAVAQNTKRLPDVLGAMKKRGLRGMIATGTVFEQDEGVGDAPMHAISLYGLSKGLTAQIVRYHCEELDVPLTKFVLSNPFGAFEEPRFGNFLVQSWRRGETPEVRTPDYVRDNLPISLAADLYAASVAKVGQLGFVRVSPSGYVESQGAFSERVARELGPRLGLGARVRLGTQTDFSEPLMRVNTQSVLVHAPEGAITAFWDDYARFYGV